MSHSRNLSIGIERLLHSLPPSNRADKSLSILREIKKTYRKILKENTEILVTKVDIYEYQVVAQLTEKVSLENEIGRPPGGIESSFRYEDLRKEAGGLNVCIEMMNIRRSCTPNCILKHIVSTGRDGRKSIAFLLVATEHIPRCQEITVQFDSDCIQSRHELQCAKHHFQTEECPVINQRIEMIKTRRNIENRIIRMSEPNQTDRLYPVKQKESENKFLRNHKKEESCKASTVIRRDDVVSEKRLNLKKNYTSKLEAVKVYSEPLVVQAKSSSRNSATKKQASPILAKMDQQILAFLIEKPQQILNPQMLRGLWKGFNSKHGYTFPLTQIQHRFEKEVAPQIPNLKNIDIWTKLRILFLSFTPVDDNFLNELRKHAEIVVDSEQRITSYGLSKGEKKRLRKRESADKESESVVKKRRKKSEQTGNEDELIASSRVAPQFQNLNQNSSNSKNPERRAVIGDFHRQDLNKKSLTPITSGSDECKSIRDFLRSLKCLVAALDRKMLKKSLKKIKKLSEELKNSDKKVSIKSIQWFLETAISKFTSEEISSKSSSERTTGLKEFLSLLKIMILGLECPQLHDCFEKIDTIIRNLGVNDKKIPLKEIRLGIDMVLSVFFD